MYELASFSKILKYQASSGDTFFVKLFKTEFSTEMVVQFGNDMDALLLNDAECSMLAAALKEYLTNKICLGWKCKEASASMIDEMLVVSKGDNKSIPLNKVDASNVFNMLSEMEVTS